MFRISDTIYVFTLPCTRVSLLLLAITIHAHVDVLPPLTPCQTPLQFRLPGNRRCSLRLGGLDDPSINPLGNNLCELLWCRLRFVVYFVVHALTYTLSSALFLPLLIETKEGKN